MSSQIKNKNEYFSNTCEVYELIKLILKEVYSKEISELGMDLLMNGISIIPELLIRLKTNFETLKNNLIILMQNNLVTYKKIIKKDIEYIGYELIIDNVFNIILFPKILSFINKMYGEYGKNIFTEFISLGVLNLHQITEQIISKKNLSNSDNIDNIKNQILITFKKLYEDNFIRYAERHQNDDIEKENKNEEIENENKNKSKNKNKINNKRSNKKKSKKEREEEEDEENERKEIENSFRNFELKLNNENSNKDKIIKNEIGINQFYEQINKSNLYFFINYNQIYAEFKSEIIINFINNNISLQAGLLAGLLLRKNKTTSFEQGTSFPIKYEEILKIYRSLNIKQIDEIVKNNTEIFIKISNDSIFLNIKKISEFIKNVILQKMILIKYSQEHLRVYRLLTLCGSLDAKSIIDQCLIIPKKVNNILNQLYQDGFLQIDNINFKNNNMLFYSVNNHQSIQKILSLDYKILKNIKLFFKYYTTNTMEQKLNNDLYLQENSKINYLYEQVMENILIMKYF